MYIFYQSRANESCSISVSSPRVTELIDLSFYCESPIQCIDCTNTHSLSSDINERARQFALGGIPLVLIGPIEQVMHMT
jgi:hypothetical protein